MGKIIVIPGASFSKYCLERENLITELYTARERNISVDSKAMVSASSFVIDYAFKKGDRCNEIEILPYSLGTLTIGRGNRNNGFTIVESRVLALESGKTTYRFDEINFDDGDVFFVMQASDTGSFKYYSAGKVEYGFSYPVREGSAIPNPQQGMSLCFNLFYTID